MPRPRYHALASLALGTALAIGGRSKRRLVAPIVSGFLIDGDHLFDFALGRLGFHGRMVLPLHGWEYVAVFLALDRRLKTSGALTAGYVCHLAMDQIWNEKRSAFSYFLAFRAWRGFRADQLGPLDPEKRHRWRHSSPVGLLRWL
ncbi:MAG: hypothetical protein EPO26_12600 [Chloroflexota bacterium]|nr:MAG: hypothetical protein EPO26_12600 [Chloroflexota bacterium]